MDKSTAEYIENNFLARVEDGARLGWLISKMKSSAWQSKQDKQRIISALEAMDRLVGKSHGLFNMHSDSDNYENELFECFKKSSHVVLPKVLKSKKMPVGFKLLVLEEYFKFFSLIYEEWPRKNQECDLKLYYHAAMPGDGFCIFLPNKLHSEDARRIYFHLTNEKQVLVEANSSYEEHWIGRSQEGDRIAIKAVLSDPFFSTSFKVLIRDVLIGNAFVFDDDTLKTLRDVRIDQSVSQYSKVVGFNSRVPGNQAYTQFRKNLLFTYFFVLLLRSQKQELRLRYDIPMLELVIRLNDEFYTPYTEPDGEQPFQLNVGKVKSFIKDFYSSLH